MVHNTEQRLNVYIDQKLKICVNGKEVYFRPIDKIDCQW